MRNVKPEYSGTYFCVDNDPYATTDSAEVIVIGKPTQYSLIECKLWSLSTILICIFIYPLKQNLNSAT